LEQTIDPYSVELRDILIVLSVQEESGTISSTVYDGLLIEGVAWSAQRILTAVNFDFLDPKPILFY
jgi:hypothetical protein